MKNHIIKQFASYLLLMGFLLGCTAKQSKDFAKSDIESIKEASRLWLEAYHQNNWKKVASFYTEDAIIMPNNQPEVIGRESIRVWFASNESGNKIELDYKEIVGCGDLAYVRGSYTLTIPIEGGSTRTEIGKLLDIRRKSRDGSWLISRDIFNGSAVSKP